LAVWCWHRLEFLPPRPGEPLVFTASFPISADGQPAHLAPSPAIEAPQGWIRTIRVETNAPVARASWLLTAQPGAQVVVLRYGEHAFEHPLQVGGRHYAPPEQHHAASAVRTVVELEPARFLGVVPGIPALGLAPWMTAYLLLAVICFLAGKRLLRVA
jgi:hypothetical protein